MSSRRSSCLNEEAANRGSLYANGKSSVENHEVKTTFARRLDQFRIGNAAVIGSSAPVVNIPLDIHTELMSAQLDNETV